MKRIVFCLLLVTHFAHAQVRLSDRAEISVLTIGPYQGELYSAFGHSAIRVYDPQNGIDDFFNYGVFDFDQPNFYLNFARGYLYYKLDIAPYPLYEQFYISQNRYFHSQELNLNPHQKQKLFDFLINNAKPENAYYRYDYFYNNCATKMRDVMFEVFGDSVQFDQSQITTDYTIRELTDLYLEYQPWGDLGIDICLGLPMDKKASPLEYMFLPDYVESGFNRATLGNKPLVKERIAVYEAQPEEFSKGFQPMYAFSIFLALTIAVTYRDFKRKKLSYAFDAFLFTILGALGLLLLLLWTATDHQAAARNLNLLWAWPTHLVAVIAFIKKPRWLSKYFLVVVVIQALLLLLWFVLPQKLHFALIPLVAAVLLRAYCQYRLSRLHEKRIM